MSDKISVIIAISFFINLLFQSCQKNIQEKNNISSIKSSIKLNIDSLIYRGGDEVELDTIKKLIDSKNGFRRLKFGTNIDSIDLGKRIFKSDTINQKAQRIWIDIPIQFENEYYSTIELIFLDKKLAWLKIRFNDKQQPFLSNKLKTIFGNPASVEKREIKEFSDKEILNIEKAIKKRQNDLIGETEKEMERLGLTSLRTRYFRSIEKSRWSGENVYIVHYKDKPPMTPKLIKNIFGHGEVNTLGFGYEYLEIGLIEYEKDIIKYISSYEEHIKSRSETTQKEEEIQKKNKITNELLNQF